MTLVWVAGEIEGPAHLPSRRQRLASHLEYQ